MIHIQKKISNTFSHLKGYLRTNVLALLTPVLLSGCMGIYEGGFECPPGKGLGCTSISDVNEQVNQGYGTQKNLSENERGDEECVPCKGKTCPSVSEESEIWFAPWVFSNQHSAIRSREDI